jgi:superfamily II DNA or RNA helicase/predicted RNA methylase
MSTLASKTKMGFFPTPETVTSLIATYIAPTTIPGARLLDPCCGEGVFAATLGKMLGLQTYGVELDTKRAAIAGKVLHRVLNLDYQSARMPLGSIDFLTLNPPYDYSDGEGKRLEYEFLRHSIKWLKPFGLLVFLVPQARVDARMANVLTSACHTLTVAQFPDADYKAFKQIVIFGVMKEKMSKDHEAATTLFEQCRGELEPLVAQYTPLYNLPTERSGKFFFRGDQLVPEDLIREADEYGAFTTARWNELTEIAESDLRFRPVVPFKRGHLASMIAAGLLKNLRLEKGGRQLLVKGRTRKIQTVVHIEDSTTVGAPPKLTVRDQFVTEIVILDLHTGKTEIISEVDALAKFIEEWRTILAEKVSQSYQPLYNFDLKAQGPKVNEVLDSLSLNRRVPGRMETGLFAAQKHASAALLKRLHVAKYALCVGSPGVGKTTISTAVAALRCQVDGVKKPTLVLCPPHLVQKWKREIEEIWPGAEAHIFHTVSDIESFVERHREHPEIPMFGVVSRERAKLGNRWSGATSLHKTHTRPDRRYKVKTEITPVCPRCGQEQSEVDTNGEAIGTIYSTEFFSVRKRLCIHCDEPLFQEAPITPTAAPRTPLAQYIARHLHHYFGLFICDEAHQFKGQATDQGYALGWLIRACDKTLALTGTIYGGRSTSLFYLLHRLSSRIRGEFGWSDGQRWAERFGILETRGDYAGREGDQGYGKFSGKLRHVTSVKEMPGVSPELVIQLLDAAVFLDLPDLGFKLPQYDEIAHEIEMPKPMKEAYQTMEREGLAAARTASRSKQKDHSVLGKVMQTLLGWPNMPSRAEQVYDQAHNLVLTAPAIKTARLSPKEEWLVDECLEQKKRGRKVIVFCRQTGTRDITEHLEGILIADGLKVANLRQSVAAEKREAWIAERAPQIDVMIVNPKIVDTGLDLVFAQSIIWFECEYSLYVLMQATKRIYRVGQTQDVEIHFAVYKGTAEQRATALAGSKWASALLLYGETVEGALAQQGDLSGSFLAELTDSIINKTKVRGLTEFYKASAVRARAVRAKAPVDTIAVPSEQVSASTLMPSASMVTAIKLSQLSMF